MITARVLIVTILCFMALVPLHVGCVRVMMHRRKAFSQQGLLMGLILAVNIPLLGCILSLCGTGNLPGLLTAGAYAVLTYNGLAYAYFHVFNMSETARRIKMIVDMRQNTVRADAIPAYEVSDMIHARLERLTLMGHIECINGFYVLRNRLFVRVDALMRAWKSLLGIGC